MFADGNSPVFYGRDLPHAGQLNPHMYEYHRKDGPL